MKTKKLTGFQKFLYLLGKESKKFWHVHTSIEIDVTKMLKKIKNRHKLSSVFLKAIDYVIRKNLKKYPELNADFLSFPYKRIKYHDEIIAMISVLKNHNGDSIFCSWPIENLNKKKLREIDKEIEERKKHIPKKIINFYKLPLPIMKLCLFFSKNFDKRKNRASFVFVKPGKGISSSSCHPNSTLQFILHEPELKLTKTKKIEERKICRLSIDMDHRILHGEHIKLLSKGLKEILEKNNKSLFK